MAYPVNKIFAHAIYKVPYEDTMLKPEDGKKKLQSFLQNAFLVLIKIST